MGLNEEQLAAATHPQGEAALLLAGAGSGKTTTATHRISWLIKDQGVQPRKILGVTFTNKAAAEIRERVLRATGLPEDQAPRLSTLHGLALSLIRRNPHGFGLGDKITPLSDYDQIDLLKRILQRDELPLNAYELRDKIEYHRARGVGFCVDYTPEVHRKALVTHAGYHALEEPERKAWSKFEQEKAGQSVLDFSDMIHFVNRRAEQDAEWLAKLQGVFQHVLMDEAQDTSICAWQFINNLLGQDNRNLFCTGDLSQSIMSFNGSSPELIMQYAEEWRGSKPALYRLVRNHRSVPEVVHLANAVQEKMTTNTLPLHMESFRGMSGEKGATRLLRGENPYEVARRIAYQIAESNRPLRDYCILVRTSMQVRDLEGELVRLRIPYVVRGGLTLLQTEEVRDIFAYLKFATNPKDFAALSRAVSAPKCGIGDAALEKVRNVANVSFGGDLLLALAASGTKFASFANIIRSIQEKVADPSAALRAALMYTNYRDYLRNKYRKEPNKVETKLENLDRLRLIIESLATESALTTEDLIFQLSMDRTEQENDERGVVTISTIHSAKGLEWNTVIVTNCVESSLPHWRSTGSEEELDEERRLFYVAITRARDNCVICISRQVQRGQGLSTVEQSRFLTELGIEPA